jgi:hypothetical protein
MPSPPPSIRPHAPGAPAPPVSALVAEQMASVPDLERFATVDELVARARALAAARPDVAALRRVGTSRLGEPLWCLTVGDGGAERDALVVGFPHPNEPFGGLTALHLAERLCADDALRARLGLRWHVAFCVDPDGARLNESWFGGPMTRERYARGFYRPAPDEQVEWTFPFAYERAYFDAVLPETLALMRLIDEVRPALLCSLHNAEAGGVYYYLSDARPALHDTLAALPARVGLPLDVGEPEEPWLERLAPAVLRAGRLADAYDHLEAAGVDAAAQLAGASCAEYAARHGTLTVVCEVPYWVDERAQDASGSGRSHRTLLHEHADALGAFGAVVLGALEAVDGALTCRTPFERATRALTRLVVGAAPVLRAHADAPGGDREATVAEAWSVPAALHVQRLREGGMLLRVLDAELAAGNVRVAVRETRARFARTFAGWLEEDARHLPGPAVPIRGPVAVQLGAIVATAEAQASEG